MSKNQITKKEESLIVNNSIMDIMSADAQDYRDNTDTNEISMPRLRILQSGSKEVKKANKAEYIEGSEEGDLFNTLTKKIYKGEDGLYFVPASRRITYLEWRDRQKGGGLVNNFGEDSTVYLNSTLGENGKRISKDCNEIVKTYDFFGFIIDMESNDVSEVVLSMSKTQVKKAKDWNALIRNETDKNSGRQLPEYAVYYKLKTFVESNDKGSWFNYNITRGDFTLLINNIGSQVYERAKFLNKNFSQSNVKVNYEEEDYSEINDKV